MINLFFHLLFVVKQDTNRCLVFMFYTYFMSLNVFLHVAKYAIEINFINLSHWWCIFLFYHLKYRSINLFNGSLNAQLNLFPSLLCLLFYLHISRFFLLVYISGEKPECPSLSLFLFSLISPFVSNCDWIRISTVPFNKSRHGYLYHWLRSID